MKHFLEEMPFYVAHRLEPDQVFELEKHLSYCAECQSELDLWRSVSKEIIHTNQRITAPAGIPQLAMDSIHREKNGLGLFFDQLRLSWLGTLSLLKIQTQLIKREIWPALAALMTLGVAVALLSGRAEAVSFIAPLIAAASITTLYGAEHDPGHELILSTPVSTWKILLARLSIVSVYNLLLAICASMFMLLIIPPDLLGVIIMGWLAPMAFLSAMALLFSLWFGSTIAIGLAYFLWIIQYLRVSEMVAGWVVTTWWNRVLDSYQEFWHSPGLLLVLAVLLVIGALISTKHNDQKQFVLT